MRKPLRPQFVLLLLPLIAAALIIQTRHPKQALPQPAMQANVIMSPCCSPSPANLLVEHPGDIPIRSVRFQTFEQPGTVLHAKSFKSTADVLMDGQLGDTTSGIISYVHPTQMRNMSAFVDLRRERPINHADLTIQVIGAVQYTALLLLSPDGIQWRTQARRGPLAEGRYRIELTPAHPTPARYAQIMLLRSNGYGGSILEWTDLRMYGQRIIPFSPMPSLPAIRGYHG